MLLKKKGFWVYCVGILLALSAAPILPMAGQGPQIQFAKEIKDFGRVKEGKILTHVFPFTNIGNSRLEIRNVTTSCGCTAALLSKDNLEPGEKGEIKVSLNTRGYSGERSWYIYIESNDVEEKRRRLTISVSIDVPPSPRIELDQYAFDMGLILEKEMIAPETVIMNVGERELQVDFSHSSATFFVNGKKLNSHLKIPAGKEAKVSMNIIPQKKTGLIREYVLMKTNDPRRANLSVYISGYVATRDQLKELFKRHRDLLK